MLAFPGCVGTPREGLPFRRRHMLGGRGLAHTRVGTCRPWGHPLAKEEEDVNSGTQV
jgi:hypothetical protein